MSGKVHELEAKTPPTAEPVAAPHPPVLRASFESWRREKERAKSTTPPKIPSPPPLRPKLRFQKKPK